MTRYRVNGPNDEQDARGLTLEEAFARLMAWAAVDYVFSRIDGTMLLQLVPTRSFSDFALLDPERTRDRQSLRALCPLFQSEFRDNDAARRDLMLQAMKADRHGYSVQEEAGCHAIA
jgi:hypothetical protein